MGLIKLLLNLIVLVVLILIAFYFLPDHIKLNQIEKLAKFVPESIQEKAEDFLLTPAERREKLIRDLEEKLAILKTAVNPEAAELIPLMEEALVKLKEENDELSFAEIAKEKLIEQFLKKGETATTTAQ